MTASSWATTAAGLPPAFLGQPYEAAVGVTAPTNITTLTSTPGNDTGLPAGLVLNADGQRITGTPTGAASTKAGTGVSQTGTGAYTFTLTPNVTDSGVTRQFTLQVYAAPTDPAEEANMSVANQAALRNATGQ